MPAEAEVLVAPAQRPAMVADYESLRSQVLSRAPGGPRLGRAVIERSGMAAWIEAWSVLPETPVQLVSGRRLDAGAEAVSILASMALAVLGGDR